MVKKIYKIYDSQYDDLNILNNWNRIDFEMEQDHMVLAPLPTPRPLPAFFLWKALVKEKSEGRSERYWNKEKQSEKTK